MTLEEERLSQLLKRAVPEPPIELSADRVTVLHADRSRRSWLVPALAAASVVAVAGATVGLGALHQSSVKGGVSAAAASGQSQASVTASASAAPAALAAAPKSLNPMQLPAFFGWLPAGFTANEPAPGQFPMAQGPLEVTPTQATFGASVVTNGGRDQRGLMVTIAARGVTPAPYNANAAQLKVLGTAPDVNGHPAKWLAGGLEWEYATGGWATLMTGGAGTQATQAGWGQACKMNVPKGSTMPVKITPSMVTCSPIPPQSTELRNELLHVATSMSWTPVSFTFPYQFTKALPQGLTVGGVTGSFVNGRLTAGELDLDVAGVTGKLSAGDTENVITLNAWSDRSSHTYCDTQAGAGTSFETVNGVKWEIQSVKGLKPDYESSAEVCSGAPVDANGGAAGLGFDDYSAASFQVGFADEKALLPIIKFLPANPANWTTSPLAK